MSKARLACRYVSELEFFGILGTIYTLNWLRLWASRYLSCRYLTQSAFQRSLRGGYGGTCSPLKCWKCKALSSSMHGSRRPDIVKREVMRGKRKECSRFKKKFLSQIGGGCARLGKAAIWRGPMEVTTSYYSMRSRSSRLFRRTARGLRHLLRRNGPRRATRERASAREVHVTLRASW